MAKGIDVSKWQGVIDWTDVKKDGIDFAMLRCGFGRSKGQEDKYFDENYAGAKKVGIPVGAYHYSYAKTAAQAKEEAEYCLSIIKGKTFEYPIAFDIEDKSQRNLGKKVISDIIRTFCETLENAGYYVVVYANLDWLRTRIDDDCKKRYDIWLAQWTDKPTFNGEFGLWQYTSSGKVAGIKGRVDMNKSYKDYPEIIKNAGLNGFSKAATKDDDPKPVQKPVQNVQNKLTAGKKVVLKNKKLFATAFSDKTDDEANGTYYIYDGEEINGRYRITNSKARVNKEPIGENVTGFVNKADLM